MNKMKIFIMVAMVFLLGACSNKINPQDTKQVEGSGVVSKTINESEIVEKFKLSDRIYYNFRGAEGEPVQNDEVIVKGASDELIANGEVLLISKDAKKETSESCMKGYLSGQFTLVFRDVRNGSVIDQVNLGDISVPKNALHMRLGATEENHLAYFVVIERYGSCNGNFFSFYESPYGTTKKIRAVLFSDTASNELFAELFDDISLSLGRRLEVSYYDNAKGEDRAKVYELDKVANFTLSK